MGVWSAVVVDEVHGYITVTYSTTLFRDEQCDDDDGRLYTGDGRVARGARGWACATRSSDLDVARPGA